MTWTINHASRVIFPSPTPRSQRSTITCYASRQQQTTLSEISIATGSKRTVYLDGHTEQQPSLDLNDDAVAESTVVEFAPLTPIQNLFLPRGWPNSVTPDYVKYQLCTVPAHITGWMSYALAGSSMLKALGIGVSPAGAVGFSAGIKWVTKDGLGAIGRMIVGGGLSSKFDEDPRRWRMLAEIMTTTGLALEIATQIYPVNFVALAGTGNLCKAVGKGMGRPCFRVVQTHFAASNNVGDVAAKEEVWEVAAQLLGLAASVAVLSALETAGNPEAIVPVWAVVHSTHVALRYFSLKTLEFPFANMKRAVAMATKHVREGQVPSITEVNAAEPVWQGPESCKPSVKFGCSLEDIVLVSHIHGATNSSVANIKSTNSLLHAHSHHKDNGFIPLPALLEVYEEQRYLLTWHDATAKVVLWSDYQPIDMLKAIWQAAWLEQNAGETADVEKLQESVVAMKQGFDDFCAQAERQGWQLHRTVMPLGPFRLQQSDSS